MRPWPRHPRPYGGGGPYQNPNPNFFPQNPNINQFPFSPQFYQQQHHFPQSPNVQNFQNPYAQPPAAAVMAPPPPPRPPQVTMERVESAAAKAQRDLVTAGENVTAWKVSQAALVSLQVDSWGSLGFQLQDVPSLRQLLATEGKINAFIHCFIGAQRITSLYDLEVAICKNEGIERFEELGLGPLCRHPLAQHYFLIPSDSVEIFKISSEDIIAYLCSLLNKSNKRSVSAEELLGLIADQMSVPVKEKLGIRIQSLGWHVSCIRQAKKSEKTILSKSLEGNKRNGEEIDSIELAPSACMHTEKQMLHKRFDSISDRVKEFSSLCDLSCGKHTHFNHSSNDEGDDYDENVDCEDINSGPHQNSSYDNTSRQSCPYPSAAEEMKRLGLKFDTGEKETPLKDKLMDVWGRSSGRSKSSSSSKKRKRKHREKRQEKHDNTMNKFLKKEEVIDCRKKLCNVTLPGGDMENFVTTWKEACREHSATEVLDLMVNFYMSSATEKMRGKFREIFSSFPGVGLLNVAVTSIKRGLSDSLYDTVQIFGDHCYAPSTEIIEINPSIKEVSVSNTTKDIDERGYRVTVDDVIRNVVEFLRRDVVMPSERELSYGKLFKALKRFCDCETWLAAQFSVNEFSSLGHGDFFNFLEKHASLLPSELCSFINGKSPEPSCVEVSMIQHQLEILLSQAESNLIDEGDVSKFDISLVLKKQFPTISFHIVGDEPERCFSDLIKRQKDCNNSSSIVYSISLLGKFLTPDFLAFQEKFPSEDTATETRTGRKIFSHGNISSKDAIDCLLKVPMLSDLLSWSHWDVLYAPSLGPLSDWLLNEGIKELLCIATMDGKFIRIDQSATVDDFLDAMVQSSPFQVALKLLSLLSLYGGVSNAPVSLLKCYVQQAVDVIIRNSTSSAEVGSREALTNKNAWQGQASRGEVSNVDTRSVDSQGCFEFISMGRVLSGINEAVINISRFILECLDYLPLEFRNFGSDILVSGLRSVAKDAHSVLLCECSRINQRVMLHDIGLSLGIAEWIDDFHEFSSKTSADLFIFSTTLHKTSLCSGSDGTSIHMDTSEKPISNNHNKFVSIAADALEADVYELNDGDNVGENGSILADGPAKRQDFGAVVGEDSVMADNIVEDATSIVESIRREEFGLDPNLNYSDSCMLKKQHARLGRALHCLSQELYSQDSHLLLELVQNADDNNYPEDVDPTLVFILREASIVVLNNEHGFSAENIRALCDIGNSTKKGSKAGYIGHKGIGFKSVFRVTDAPEIHSKGFHVKFDITEGQIGFVLPTVIPSCNVDMFRRLISGERYSSNDTQWNTCIVLPFRSKSIEGTGMTSIITMFSDLHPSLLLFLHRLKCIKFMNMLNNTLVDMRREILGNGIVKVSHGQETMTWLVISKKLSANLIRSDVKSTEIAVAFTLEECESGEYKPHLSQQPVFAFLPLRNYGLKFILQGDFVLPSSREEVDGNSAWNQWLLSEFPALFVSAEQSFCSLSYFQEYPGKAVTIYLSFVPVGGEVHGFFSRLPQMIISKLRMSNCLLLDGPDLTWVLPCRVLRGWNEQARMLLSDSLLQKHLGLGYLSKDIELSDALAKALGIQDYGPKVLIEIISSVCCSKDSMSLGLDWLSAWLGVLHSALSTNSGHHYLHVPFEHDLINSLRKIPFIPLSDGSYSSVVDGSIWLPCDVSSVGNEGKYSATEFPSLYAKLRTVNPLLLSAATNNMYSIEKANRDNLVHMLCKIGVQQLSAHEVIKSHILLALSIDKYMDEHKNLMIEYLSFILLHFQYDCARCCSEKKEIILELQKSPVLLTNRGYKCPIEEPVHFGREYMNPVDTDKFSCTMDYRWLEVDAVYLKHPSIQSLSLGVQKWRNFFQELGVTDFVQVSCTRKSSSDNLCTFSGDTTPVGDLTVASSFIDDWESSELLNFLSTFSSNKCREKCIYLLEVLDKMWDDIYNAYSRSCIVSKINENKRTIESTFMKSLRHFEWIASSTDHDLHRSKDLFYDCVEVRSILGNLAPYAVPQVTSKLLLKDIGFKTEVSLDDALEILHFWNMSEAPCRTSILQMSKLYTFISDGLIRSKLKIIEEFTSNSFIFVPFLTSRHNDTVSGVFLSPKELYWHDPTGCVDKTKELVFLCSSTEGNSSVPCKALETVYPGLYDFFVNVCGVPKSPPSCSYFQILLQLSSIAPPSQAAHMVFQVFVKWANDLKSGLVNPGEILELKENLLKLENTVLPTLQDKWVSLHSSFGLICWPDDDELKEQFKHSDGIDFLHFGELKKEDHDKLYGTIATLMHDIGVPALSEVVSREAIFYGTHENREKISVINWILPYAQRYIYKLYADTYLGLKQLGFEKLSQLQVIVVDKLFYKNYLKGRGNTSKKRFECSCLLQGTTLYTTLTADTHSIFLELSRLFFNGSTELHFANFLHMVTTMAESGSTSEQTEFFILNSQKIPMLPDEEPVWCFSSITEPTVVEDSQPSLAPMSVDQNSQTAEKKPGHNTNWPPTGWRTAPDMSYAKANYHLTKPRGPSSMYREKGSTRSLDALPVTDDLPIPVEIDTEWIIEEGTTAATTILLQDSVLTNNLSGLEPVNVVDGLGKATSEPNSQLGDSALVPAPQRERLRYDTNDEHQLWKTGRIGEMIAYKYFVDKLGSENVRWVNEGAETGLPYDIITGVEESSREYIEVKATRYSSKDWFEISTREWQFAVERGHSYSVAHVVMGEKKASISVLRNPLRLCQQNLLHLALLMSRHVKESAVTS